MGGADMSGGPFRAVIDGMRRVNRAPAVLLGVWALTVLVSLLGLFFLWAVAVHPTPQEHAGLYDSLGKTTGVHWARPDEKRER